MEVVIGMGVVWRWRELWGHSPTLTSKNATPYATHKQKGLTAEAISPCFKRSGREDLNLRPPAPKTKKPRAIKAMKQKLEKMKDVEKS